MIDRPTIDVSVVVPAKNRARTLPYCLDSILTQTYPAREVVVVDDSSTDQTADVVASFGSRGVRLVQLTEGEGAQAARNAGIRAAQFPWIAFQDSDDRWLPTKLERQAAALARESEPECVVVHSGGVKIQANSRQSIPLNVGAFDGHCYAELLLKSGPMFQGLLVHRSALEEIGLLDVHCPSFQEWDTAIRLAAICKFLYVDEALFEWVWHGSEAISKDFGRDLRGHEYVLQKHRSEIQRVHGERGWRKAVVDLVGKALAGGASDTAMRLARENLKPSAVLLAGVFARAGGVPRGGVRLMRLMSGLPL